MAKVLEQSALPDKEDPLVCDGVAQAFAVGKDGKAARRRRPIVVVGPSGLAVYASP